MKKQSLIISIYTFLLFAITWTASAQFDVRVRSQDGCQSKYGMQSGFYYEYENTDLPLPLVIKYRKEGTMEYTLIYALSYADFISVPNAGVYEVIFQTSDDCIEIHHIIVNVTCCAIETKKY